MVDFDGVVGDCIIPSFSLLLCQLLVVVKIETPPRNYQLPTAPVLPPYPVGLSSLSVRNCAAPAPKG